MRLFPLRGFTIIMWPVVCEAAMGTRWLAEESFSRAFARPSPVPTKLAPEASALYSRVREMAICTIIAAMGAIMAVRRRASG